MIVCHSLIAYRCDFGDGDPLRWSPTLAGLCMLDHFPVKVSLDAPDVALVPDVLAAWVAFAARRRTLPEPALARILDVIDTCREDFPVAMGDVSRYSPAKRTAMDLLHRGIDLTDDDPGLPSAAVDRAQRRSSHRRAAPTESRGGRRGRRRCRRRSSTSRR